jgi:hypothetical protein
VVGEAVAAPVIDDAGNIYGLRAGTWTAKITSGKNSGKSMTWSLGPSQEAGSSGSWRGAMGDSQVIFLTKTDDGHVVAVSDIEHAHGGPEVTLQEIIALAMEKCFFLDRTF